MIIREAWLARLERAWKEAPIVWLCGVRRSGKTTLAHSLDPDRTLYVNCDIPATEEMVRDPQLFFKNCRQPIVVFDEIHQLKDPSRILKIGADLFPQFKILATGSSTLGASRKFKDTLTGRKRTVHLLPVTVAELAAFHDAPLLKRLYHGGLPPALLADEKAPAFYREWMDSFFARDVQKLFAFRNSEKFNAVFEYIMKQSGGMLEVSRMSSALAVARATIETHLEALEITHAVTLVRPFHGGGRKELVKTPKAYAFDTGFVSFHRGWDPLRPDDYGTLWEHLVLEYLQSKGIEKPQYWHDHAGKEVDFVIPRDRSTVDAVECKWDPTRFDATSIRLFREYYPEGVNYVVSPQTVPAYSRRISGLEFHFCAPEGLRLT